MERNGGFGDPRIAYAYIDQDDIPEILLAAGTFHSAGVNVFTMLQGKNEAVWIGEFSTYGRLSYNEKKNRIMSGHGNQGLFMLNLLTTDDRLLKYRSDRIEVIDPIGFIKRIGGENDD